MSQQIRNMPLPPKIDFLLFTVNEYEETATRVVFDFPYEDKRNGAPIHWGYFSEQRRVVAHKKFLDSNKGVDQAIALTGQLIRELSPDNIFMLGTAAHIVRKKKNHSDLRVGDVAVSCYVHAARYTKGHKEIANLPLVQPSPSIIASVENLSNYESWKNFIPENWQQSCPRNGSFKSHIPISKRPKVIPTEFVSVRHLTNYAIEDPVTMRYVKQQQRAGAVDMELGGIGAAIFEALAEKQRTAHSFAIPAFAGIKGISDPIYVYRRKPGKIDRIWISCAVSFRAAALARAVIEKYPPPCSSIVRSENLLTKNQTELLLQNNALSGVFHNVTSKSYSGISEHILNYLTKTAYSEKKSFFTVFCINLHNFFQEVSEKTKKENRLDREPLQRERLDWAHSQMPHFRTFSNLASQGFEGARVLVLEERNVAANRQIQSEEEWDLFYQLNGDVCCWVVSKSALNSKVDVNDHAILSDKVRLEYSDAAEILMISDFSRLPAALSLGGVFEQFNDARKSGNTYPFVSLDNYDKEVRAYFYSKKYQSHLFPGFRFVNQFPSIMRQRDKQADILKDRFATSPGGLTLLSVGCAFGDELAHFARTGALEKFDVIHAIDVISEVEAELFARPELKPYLERLSFTCMNANELPDQPFGKNHWDCIQCGFVLEDVHYRDKPLVYEKLYDALKLGGLLIISEMFLDNRIQADSALERQRKESIADLYDGFINEATALRSEGQLSKRQLEILLGNKTTSGLLGAKKNAQQGVRDFFEGEIEMVNSLERIGFQVEPRIENESNSVLKILLAKKLAEKKRIS